MKWAGNPLEVTLSRSSSGTKGLMNHDKVKSAGPKGSHLRLSHLESSLRALSCPEQVQGRGRKRWRGEGKRGNKQRGREYDAEAWSVGGEVGSGNAQ